MNLFERYLTVWVFLCIVVGVLFGQLAPSFFHALANLEVAHVNNFNHAMEKIAPFSMSALLLTLVLLFALQGNAIVKQPVVIALLAVPILLQVLFNASLAYGLNHRLGVAHCVAAPSALIAASNFFELAVATAISLFGFESGAALATVVGVLIEVPVMLLVVKVANASQGWYERSIAQ